MLNGMRRFTSNGQGGLISSPYKTTASASVMGRNYATTADAYGGGGGSGVSVGASIVGKNPFVGILDGFLPADDKIRNKIFRDIYHHDPVSGAAVDIYATMPFSDFYLTGLKDREALDVFHRSIEKMRLKTILPSISRDYMVLGKFIGTTVFDSQENMFSAIMQQDVDSCTIIDVPFAGQDPIINLTFSPKLRALLANKNDPRVANMLNVLPDYIRDNYRKGEIPLQPSNTLYVPRRTLASDSSGTSYYERILPIHIMEKAMIRGSTDQVQRRQRAILHITMGGDGDEYVPTLENLEAMRNLFALADADPTGAIIVTHTGVNPNEIRDAAGFFRSDELFEYFNSSKYKALGISEAMVTGEANFNAMDATLSLFVDNLRDHRSTLTREIFYEKIFPAIAYANNFTKERYTVTGSKHVNPYIREDEGYMYAVCTDERHGFNTRENMVDTSTLAIPKISWQKHLRPQGDETFINLLTTAASHGVPIPLMMFASASGVDLDSILNDLDQEYAIRKRVKKYEDKLAEFAATDDQGGYQAQSGVFEALAARNPRIKPKSILSREYPDYLQPHNTDKMGRFKNTSTKQRARLYDKSIKTLSEVLSKNNEMNLAEARQKRKPR